MSIPTIKVLLLGDPYVGKTSLRGQFVHKVFSNSYRATVGADYLSTRVALPDSVNLDTNEPNQVYLQVWDTAGQERFNSLIKNFYRGTDVAIFVYDVCNPQSFHNLHTWIQEFLENVQVNNPAILIVGNKCDRPVNEQLISMRQCKEMVLSNAYLDQYMTSVDDDIFYVSARNFSEVRRVFERAGTLAYGNLEGNRSAMSFDRVDIEEIAASRCC